MEVEQKLNDYLNKLKAEGVFKNANLVGIEGDGGIALVLDDLFGETESRYIFIFPEKDSYNYKFIVNDAVNSKGEEKTIEENILNNFLIKEILYFIAESIPKNKNIDDYFLDKSSVLIKFWKRLMKLTPEMFDQKIIDGFKNLEIDNKNLTDDQIQNKKYVENWFNKLKIRYKIETRIGDVYDLIADMSKRISFLEKTLYNIVSTALKDSKNIDNKLIELSNFYVNKINEEKMKDRIDYEEKEILLEKLLNRSNEIANIFFEFQNQK